MVGGGGGGGKAVLNLVWRGKRHHSIPFSHYACYLKSNSFQTYSGKHWGVWWGVGPSILLSRGSRTGGQTNSSLWAVSRRLDWLKWPLVWACRKACGVRRRRHAHVLLVWSLWAALDSCGWQTCCPTLSFYKHEKGDMKWAPCWQQVSKLK